MYMTCKIILLLTFLNQPRLILYSSWFQVFQSNSNNSIYNKSLVSTVE